MTAERPRPHPIAAADPVDARAAGHLARLPRAAVPLGLVLLGSALRIGSLAHQSFWYDEAASILIATKPVDQIIAAAAADTLPPLAYLILHGWLALVGNTGELSLRWPSAAFSTLTLALLCRLGRELVDRRAALTGLAIAALAPFAVFYAQEVRQYSLLGCLLVLTMWLTLQVWRRSSRRLTAGLALTTAAALYTHVMAGLTLAALAGLSLARHSRRAALRPLGAGLLLFSPWLLVLPRQIALVESAFWASPPSVLAPVASLYAFVFAHTLGPLLPIGLGWVLVLIGLTVRWTLSARAEPHTRQAAAMLTVLIGCPLVLALVLSFRRPIYLDRTLIGAAWPLYLLLGRGLTRAPRPVGALLGAGGFALLTFGLINLLAMPAYGKPPLRAAATVVAADRQPGDRVLHTSDGSYYPFLLYGVAGDLLAGDPEYRAGGIRASFSQILGTKPVDLPDQAGHRLWLVLLADHSVAWQWQQKATLDTRLGSPVEIDVGGIKLFRYGDRP